MTLYSFTIGTAYGSITNIEGLTVPVVPPKPTYSPYSTLAELSDGGKRGIGAPKATWHWDFLPRAMRDQLRLFCAGVPSKAVCIRTLIKDNAGAWRYFDCMMHWPVGSEETQTNNAIDFTLEFTQLVDVTPA